MKFLLKLLKGKKKLFLVVLFFIVCSLFIGRNLFSNSLLRTDDLEHHGARLGNYYLALKQKQLPPYWGSNLNYGFGYPVFLFSYQFPYMVAVVFYALGLSIEVSLNASIVFFLLLGGLGIFSLSYLQNKKIFLAFVSGLIYQTTPYMLLNIFVRGALGEIAFLGLLPWVFVMIKTREKSSKWWYQILSIFIFSSLILSHPVSLIVAGPLILAWLFFDGFYSELKSRRKDNYAIKFLFNGLFSLGITAFYWLPFIFEKKYIVVDSHSIIKNFSNRYLPVKQLFFSRWGHGGADMSISNDVFPATLGLSILIILFFSLIKLIKFLKKGNSIKKYRNVIFWLGIFSLTIFLMLPISKIIWDYSKILPYLQYPWRLFWVTTFSGIMILNSWKKVNKFILYIILIIVLHHSVFYTNPIGYIRNSNHDWLEYSGTSTSANELKSKWFDEHKNIGITEKVVLNPQSPNEKINITSWSGSEMVYEIETDDSTNVLQKTMFFPGWEVYVDEEKVDINYQTEEFPGRITFPIEKGKHDIKVSFTNNTPARKIGIYLTTGSIFVYLGVLTIFIFKAVRKE